jgi:hypothetical protein
MTTGKIWLLIIVTALVMGSLSSAGAAETVNIDLKTVLASNESDKIDPQIADLAQELQSVFRYSSYRLINHNKMALKPGQTGEAPLPGNRVITITVVQVDGNRANLKLRILKDNRQIFETVAELLNNRSLTVGGPKHQNGYLLFNITSSF